ncbi:MAG: NUDIX domain-containing protein [Anaerolineae bacterium]|nr:NUDIX domain-containing protein [Anaerolineae bacterium]
MELLDIYDENLVHIGVKEREAVHREGDWHRTFHCWIVYCDERGLDFIVLQRRGPDKQTYPNLLDVSAAGHYAAGETMADGVREIAEELGIQVYFNDLVPVGLRYSVYRQDGVVDYEFNDVFLLNDDRPLSAYEPQAAEVSDLVCFRIDDGLALFDGTCDSIPAESRAAGDITLRQTDFVDPLDRYTYRVLVLARRFLNGESHLVI